MPVPQPTPTTPPPAPRPEGAPFAGYEGIALDATPRTPDEMRRTAEWIAHCAQRVAEARRVCEARLVIDPQLMNSRFRR